METAVKAALALIAKRDATTSSQDLDRVRAALDLPGARAEIEKLEEHRRGMLLTADDRSLNSIDARLHAAARDRDRRQAASDALETLIEAASLREAENEVELMAEEARNARLRALEAYVALDKAALGVVELLGTIREAEEFITQANRRFSEAGRGALRVGQPMVELSLLAGCDGQFLPMTSRFVLPGYLEGPTGRFGNSLDQLIGPERRFGRLAELLPTALEANGAAVGYPTANATSGQTPAAASGVGK